MHIQPKLAQQAPTNQRKFCLCGNFVKSFGAPLAIGLELDNLSFDHETLLAKYDPNSQTDLSHLMATKDLTSSGLDDLISTGFLPEQHEDHAFSLQAAIPQKAIPQKLRCITNREVEILQLLMQGGSVKSIAKTANISIHTVTSHMKEIYRKLEVHSKNEAIYAALPLLSPNLQDLM